MEAQKESQNYDPKVSEKKWQVYWESNHTYRFDREDTEKEVYSIDTPPPTVSGKMHLGHAFSYSQMDFIARYKRMKGYNVFYPFGTDDNGLPTERLVEKTKNVKSTRMQRSEFIKLCLETLDVIRPGFIQDWKNTGMSCDFTLAYSTINDHCRRISQKSFVELYKKGLEYRKEAPSIWCPECQTAIAQVELEDKELDSAFNHIIFMVGQEKLIIATTRPELLASCTALFVNPEDDRYKKYVGKEAVVPLFNHKVKILADARAAMDKGTGAVMCCTFGDQTDIEWYKAYNLALRISITKDGKMNDLAGQYKDLKLKEAREKIIGDLKTQGLLVDQKPIKHVVNVHERCGTPIEIMNTKQWFVKYLHLKEEFSNAGSELHWYPSHMRSRLENWINGLQWDWCISRQRHFGVPFPVWYCSKCDEIVLADTDSLPVDPTEMKCPEAKCKKCGNSEFTAEKDVMDTWATSSLTPELAGELIKGTKNYDSLYPMDLRPQAHDIITFWLFNTLVKSRLHHKRNPWKNVMISGWALDPSGKKMSKSKGNTIEPQVMIEKYSADALRYWAAGSKLGDDLPFKEKDMMNGKKMITKLWNASRFSIMHLGDFKEDEYELELMDKWVLSKLQKLIKICTETFDSYEYSRARQELEMFFWNVFCDNYLEIVKDRLYNPDKHREGARESGQYALHETLLNILKIAAPVLPYVTEEIYQLHFAKIESKKSIHVSAWPVANETLINEDAEHAGDMIVEIISRVRKFKSDKSLSLNSELAQMVVECKDRDRRLIEPALMDLKAVCKVKDIEFGAAEELNVILS
ncbi:MAG: valine--tRNA ligase [Nanoarchaeota archaeon]|nr:valine--tRNA ligase [Nanoarchaeota archaeon]